MPPQAQLQAGEHRVESELEDEVPFVPPVSRTSSAKASGLAQLWRAAARLGARMFSGPAESRAAPKMKVSIALSEGITLRSYHPAARNAATMR